MIGVRWDPWRFNLGFVSFSMSTKMGLLNSFCTFIYFVNCLTVIPSTFPSSLIAPSFVSIQFHTSSGKYQCVTRYLSQTCFFPFDREGEICGSFCFLNGFFLRAEGRGGFWKEGPSKGEGILGRGGFGILLS